MGAPGRDPLEVDSPELRVAGWYAGSRRAIRRGTVEAVPASWPGVVRRPLVGLATVVAAVVTLVAWIPVTVIVAFNLLGRHSPSGR